MNKLFYGDNLYVLRRHIKDESVDLCYIDPPFNSKRNYNQIYNNVGKEDRAQAQAFVDTWTWDEQAIAGLDEILHDATGKFTYQTIQLMAGLDKVLGKGSLFAYIVSMTLRIVEIHRALKPTGSFYLHCDPSASHYLKIVLDAVFCAAGGDFKNEIVWKRTTAHNSAKRWGDVHDTILFYTKSENCIWNQIYQQYEDNYLKVKYKNKDSRGTYRLSDLTGAGLRNGESGSEWLGFNPTTSGRHWAIPKEIVESIIGADLYPTLSVMDKLNLLKENDFIYFSPKSMFWNFIRPAC